MAKTEPKATTSITHAAHKSGENWSRRAVVYHIYPRSFKDSNGDGVGDIRGILEKLDYLNDGTQESLGIGAIWISPIFRSPMADFGYDISDHLGIDPVFGDLAVFDELVREAHGRGIRVIMDFVPNHTSEEHLWFLESRSSRNSPKRGWYVWRDPKPDGSPPNNWISVFGGPAWTLDAKTGQYYCHSFLPEQPDLNWENPEVKEAMLGVLRFWFERGVDGFRIDAIHHLAKDPEFRDDPPNPEYVPGKMNPYKALIHTYSRGSPKILEHINSFCEVAGAYENKFLVTEAYIELPELAAMYCACSNNLHAPFNFNLMKTPWIASAYRAFIDEFDRSLLEGKWPNYVMGNHDRPRLATRLGKERARTAAMLLLTLRGMPFIYQGDEFGMEDVPVPRGKVRDPREDKNPGLGLGRDPERTPMQWSGEKYAGFSTVEPWLPLAENYGEVNVEAERKDPRSMLNLYRELIRCRNSSPVLLSGAYRSIDVRNENVFAYVREYSGDRMLILLNFEGTDAIVQLEESASVVLSTLLDVSPGKEIPAGTFTLRPNEGIILQSLNASS